MITIYARFDWQSYHIIKCFKSCILWQKIYCYFMEKSVVNTTNH